MLKIVRSNRFLKDLKNVIKRGYSLDELKKVIDDESSPIHEIVRKEKLLE